MVQETIIGSKKVCTDPICCKLPICLTHLHIFLEIAISSQEYDDLLFITILSCCFYGCHHLGELILKNGKDEFHWQKIIKCGSLIFGVDHISYCLPYHKTDHFYHGTTVLFFCEDGSFPNCVWFDKRFFALLDHYFGGHSFMLEELLTLPVSVLLSRS